MRLGVERPLVEREDVFVETEEIDIFESVNSVNTFSATEVRKRD